MEALDWPGSIADLLRCRHGYLRGTGSWQSGRRRETVIVDTPEPERTRWPQHLPVGAMRVVRWSTHYDQTVIFYRDIIGLPVLETFRGSYGLDGTILGLPEGPVHLEIARLTGARQLPWAGSAGVLPARCARPGADHGTAGRCGPGPGCAD
jgi:hypothetical protein